MLIVHPSTDFEIIVKNELKIMLAVRRSIYKMFLEIFHHYSILNCHHSLITLDKKLA